MSHNLHDLRLVEGELSVRSAQVSGSSLRRTESPPSKYNCVVIILLVLFFGNLRAEGVGSDLIRANNWNNIRSTVINSEGKSTTPARSALSAGEIRRHQGKAFRRSLVLPGWGQFSNGDKVKGYIFAGIETSLLVGLVSSQVYGNWLENDYQAFASQHAGVPLGRPHQFYVDMGNWMNQREYNEQRLRDRDFEALYNDMFDHWQWDSDENRARFKDMRISSDSAKRLTVFMVGGLIINHLASAIDAARGTPMTTVSVVPMMDGRGGMVSVFIR